MLRSAPVSPMSNLRAARPEGVEQNSGTLSERGRRGVVARQDGCCERLGLGSRRGALAPQGRR